MFSFHKKAGNNVSWSGQIDENESAYIFLVPYPACYAGKSPVLFCTFCNQQRKHYHHVVR